MEKITNSAELKAAIDEKKIVLKTQWKELREQAKLTYESHKPMNLILDSLQDIVSPSTQAENMFGAISGLLTGYLSKKFAVGKSENLLRRILGSVLQFSVTSFIAQHADEVKTYGQLIIDMVFGKKAKRQEME